jgi:hypothetical protein
VKRKYEVWRLTHKCCQCGKETQTLRSHDRIEKMWGECCSKRPSLLIETELVEDPTWEQIVSCYEHN